MSGFIKLHRCLINKPIWKNSTPEQKTILITLLLMVNHSEQEWEWEGKKFKVYPGQTITSLENIVKECGKGISVQNARTALKRFEKLEFLTNQSTKTGRLISIVNWRDYQDTKKEINKDNNKDITNNQQRPNKDLTPNKNDKNDKNDKNIFLSDSNEYRLAEYLRKYILRNNPKAKVPSEDKMQSWCKTMNLIIRVDKRGIEDIKKHIQFSQTDTFWQTNILSPTSLRKQYDQLTMKMKVRELPKQSDQQKPLQPKCKTV